MLQSSTVFPMHWCSRIVIGLCSITIAIACLAIIGWQLNLVSLTSISPSYEPLHVATAVLIILTSISIFLIRHIEVRRQEYYFSKMLAAFILFGNISVILHPY